MIKSFDENFDNSNIGYQTWPHKYFYTYDLKNMTAQQNLDVQTAIYVVRTLF